MKRVVDFNCREPLCVVPQHLLLWKLFRVEVSLPLLEAIAAGADEETHDRSSVFEILNLFLEGDGIHYRRAGGGIVEDAPD